MADSLLSKSGEMGRERERVRAENCHFIVATYRVGSPPNRPGDLVDLETYARE